MAEKMTMHDRVEFALRDAGFDPDEASRIATLAESNIAQPAQAVDAQAIADSVDPIVIRLHDVTAKLEAANAEIERLNAEIAEALKYARRYRWLRSKNLGDGRLWEVIYDEFQPGYQGFKYENGLDIAIDAAMHNSAQGEST
jgi:hypothetical protein